MRPAGTTTGSFASNIVDHGATAAAVFGLSVGPNGSLVYYLDSDMTHSLVGDPGAGINVIPAAAERSMTMSVDRI